MPSAPAAPLRGRPPTHPFCCPALPPVLPCSSPFAGKSFDFSHTIHKLAFGKEYPVSALQEQQVVCLHCGQRMYLQGSATRFQGMHSTLPTDLPAWLLC